MILVFHNKQSGNYFAALNEPPYIRNVANKLDTFISLYRDEITLIDLPNMDKIKEYRKQVAPIFSNQPNLQLGEVFKQHFPELLL